MQVYVPAIVEHTQDAPRLLAQQLPRGCDVPLRLGDVALFRQQPLHVRLIPYHKAGHLEPGSRTVQRIIPRRRSENVLYTAIYLPVMLGFFWGVWRGWREAVARPLLGYTLILTGCFCLLYALTTYMTRYRLPVEPFFYLFAARGWLEILSRLSRRAFHPSSPDADREAA